MGIKEIEVGVDEKKNNTGDEKGLSTFLWSFTTFFSFLFHTILGGVLLHRFFPFLFSHHLGWCVFLGGRKMEGWDEKENWEVGDKDGHKERKSRMGER